MAAATTRKFHKSFKELPCSCYSVYDKINHLVLGLDANKALGFALFFISILATCHMLYFSYSTHGNALTYTHVTFNPESNVILKCCDHSSTAFTDNYSNVYTYIAC